MFFYLLELKGISDICDEVHNDESARIICTKSYCDKKIDNHTKTCQECIDKNDQDNQNDTVLSPDILLGK